MLLWQDCFSDFFQQTVSAKKIGIFLANNKDIFTKIGTYTNSTMLSPNLSC